MEVGVRIRSCTDCYNEIERESIDDDLGQKGLGLLLIPLVLRGVFISLSVNAILWEFLTLTQMFFRGY